MGLSTWFDVEGSGFRVQELGFGVWVRGRGLEV